MAIRITGLHLFCWEILYEQERRNSHTNTQLRDVEVEAARLIRKAGRYVL